MLNAWVVVVVAAVLMGKALVLALVEVVVLVEVTLPS
jgi:hypothetical protein